MTNDIQAEKLDDEPTTKDAQAEKLIKFAEDCECFHTAERQAFITVPVHDHEETYAIQSRDFRLWLTHEFYAQENKTPSQNALKNAMDQIESRAIFDAPEGEVHVRIAKHDGYIYIDLCNQDWQVLKVTSDCYDVYSSKDVPVKFRRTRGMRALPAPAEDGSIQPLRDLVNVASESQWRLLVAWLVMAFNPNGPYPVLGIHGQQGSAKSTLMKILRRIVDPHVMPIRSEPKEARDLMIAATNTRLLAFDNLSEISTWLSDSFCRLSTGGGFATRQLYVDAEEQMFSAMRPIVLNGIEAIATRPDLLERSIILNLEAIPEEKRLTEKELNAKVETALPGILAGILQAVMTALHHQLSFVSLPKLPRMADFCHWVTAAESGLGWPEGTFLADYNNSLNESNDIALEAYVIVAPLRALIEKSKIWEGTASELLAALQLQVGDTAARAADWPKRPNKLSGLLKRLTPNLRKIGVEVARIPIGTGNQKRWGLRITMAAPQGNAAAA